ncbi:MAG TPA: hypothetical protein VNI52_13025 [Sphingobacteriaceae bacterium]|nr:hypothetical protein [Sphingobacteriaceae bacterium]
MKRTALILLFILIVAVSFGLYQYSRPASTVINVQPEWSLSASELKKQLSNDPSLESKFSNKAISIEGKISSFETAENTTTLLIDSSVRCEFLKDFRLPKELGHVKITGLFAGYDELFEEVLLVKCKIENRRSE